MTGSVQLAMLMPLVLAVIFAIIQASIWFAGRSCAQQAAMAGAERAAYASGLADDAYQVSAEVAERGGLQQVDIGFAQLADTIQVNIVASVPALLPGPWSTVEASAVRVKEA